jgi:hypothetical protein
MMTIRQTATSLAAFLMLARHLPWRSLSLARPSNRHCPQ